MARVLEQVTPWQARFRREHGLGWVYLSDEWYLALGRDVPTAGAYDGYPQIENGVGMVRQFLDGWEEGKAQSANHKSQIANRKSPLASGQGRLVCGTLIAPLMTRLMYETGLQVEVLPVVNQFFGPTVTVSGLLVGQDVVAALKERVLDGPVFLPRAMFDAAGERTLDDCTLEAMEGALGVPVIVAGSLDRVLEQLVPGKAIVKELP
jgi:NifB/MoaA-like Fe-S oxidoreductase